MIKKDVVFRKSWVFTTYFAQGLPYSLIAVIPSIMFRDLGANLSTIGFLSLLNIPWVIKFLWAPFVDSNSTLKKWIYSTELGITAVISLIALSLFSDGLVPVVLFLFLGAVISATHDIAVDGFYMVSMDEPSQKKEIGFRVLAYRLALAFGSGFIISIGTVFSWRCAFGTAAFFMLVIY
ncbi:MAG TPA: MFS transporter, partial [bacterium]|nr:MFS transporter [bacterium]